MKYIVKAWNIGNYTTSAICKSFADIKSAIAYASTCNRDKSQIIDQFTREIVKEIKRD